MRRPRLLRAHLLPWPSGGPHGGERPMSGAKAQDFRELIHDAIAGVNDDHCCDITDAVMAVLDEDRE
jgi:hypothetical protein